MDAESFGHRNFSKARLGDKRRVRRLVDLADRMAARPGGTLPDKIRSPADLRALYRLMDCEKVTHESILQPHRELTRERIAAAAGTVLVIHDTTELDYTSKHALGGLGQIGGGVRRGFLCHNSLAVAAGTREVLGLANQILHVRPPGEPKKKGEKKKKKSVAASREAKDRESLLWLAGVEGCGPAPEGSVVVDVCDRGADTFEFLQFERKKGRTFVVRSTQDRSLADGGKLHAFARTLKPLFVRTVEVQESLARTGRTATVGVAAAKVVVAPPKEQRGLFERVPEEVWIVRVWELSPEPHEEPLEWLLLTNAAASTAAEAGTVVDWYATRPVVEEYHKGQKTGCAIEGMQFRESSRMQPAIALLSVVALTLLSMRFASRMPDAKERLATEFLAREYVEVLSWWRWKQRRTDVSLHDFYVALARLGGHQNRKRDHPPGWLILWRGWTSLQDMVCGFEAARSPQRCG